MQGKRNAGMLARGSEGYEEKSKESKEKEEEETGTKAQDEDEVEYDIGRQQFDLRKTLCTSAHFTF